MNQYHTEINDGIYKKAADMLYGTNDLIMRARQLRKQWGTKAILDYSPEGSIYVQEAEKLFGDKVNWNHPLLVPSGTAAFLTALLSIDFKNRSLVALPVNICHCIVDMVILAGLIPIFIDIDETSTNINLDHFERVADENIAAVLFVHSFGYPGDIHPFQKVCGERGIVVIEDCAQSPTASIQGKAVGHDGLVSIYSFGRNKPISGGGGGMVCTNDTELAENMRLRAKEGGNSQAANRMPGLNLFVNDLQACYIMGALLELDIGRKCKEEKVALYEQALRGELSYIGEDREKAGLVCDFHRLIIRLPLPKGTNAALFEKNLIQKYGDFAKNMAQTAYPVPPFMTEYVQKYYYKMKRGDLVKEKAEFPGWQRIMDRRLFLQMNEQITLSDVKRWSDILLNEIKSFDM